MRRSIHAIAIACLGFASSTFACWDASTSRPMEIAEHKFHKLLFDADHAELDRLAELSFDGTARIPDGQPLRMAMIGGVVADEGACRHRMKAMDPAQLARLEPYREKLEAWLRQYPASRSAQLMNALYPLEYSNAARGNEYASEVPDEAWAIFREQVQKARAQLEALPPEARKDPEWHRMMLRIARDQSWSDSKYQALLDAAMSKFPAYVPLYFEAATRADPKWGGSEEKLRALIEKAAARNGAGPGDEIYARLWWANRSPRMFAGGRVSWPRMKKGFERIVKEYPDPWNVNNFGKFACMAMDANTLRDVLARIETPVLQAWESMESWVYCKNLAAI